MSPYSVQVRIASCLVLSEGTAAKVSGSVSRGGNVDERVSSGDSNAMGSGRLRSGFGSGRWRAVGGPPASAEAAGRRGGAIPSLGAGPHLLARNILAATGPRDSAGILSDVAAEGKNRRILPNMHVMCIFKFN